MNNLDPALRGCDTALAEAESLIAMLAEAAESLDPELSAVQARIAALRREVERLRGMPAAPMRGRIHPDWIDLAASGSPWGGRGGDRPCSGDHRSGGQAGGV